MFLFFFQEYLVPSASSHAGLDQKSANRDDSDDDEEGGGELDLTDIDDAEIGNFMFSSTRKNITTYSKLARNKLQKKNSC